MTNLMWRQDTGAYDINLLLAVLAMSTWTKLLMRLMVTESFGPFFKVIGMMLIDLAKFAVLWGLFLVIFASGASMVFGQIPSLRGFGPTFYLYFEASLGAWDKDVYCDAAVSDAYCYVGYAFTVAILLVNMVLLLNLVIAILSSTYAYYEDKKLGLYYEVLVGKFPTLQYDDNYGVAACAQPPLNLMIVPFWWVTLLPWSQEFVDKYISDYNQFLCHLLYAPFAVAVTAIFTVRCVLYAPVAYVGHVVALIQTLTDSDETMDEFHEKLARFFTIVQFIFGGPFILVFVVPIDAANFFVNLYSKPFVQPYDASTETISK